MRIVLDTDVVVRALRRPNSASAALVEAALDGRVTLLASPALGLEYEAVCLRPEHVKAASLQPLQVEAFLDGLAHIVEPVRIHFAWRGFLPDANDDLVLEAVLNAGADALVTFNRRHFEEAAVQFGLRLALPSDILTDLEKLE